MSLHDEIRWNAERIVRDAPALQQMIYRKHLAPWWLRFWHRYIVRDWL